MEGQVHTDDISGLKFEQLSPALQDILERFPFDIVFFDHLTAEEEREMFKRLNAGKPLSSKSRSLASCKNIEEMLEIGQHRVFTEMLSEKSLDNKSQVAIVMKIWCMMYHSLDDLSFEGRVLNPMLESAEISEAQKEKMLRVLDLIAATHDEMIERKAEKKIYKRIARKLYTETHLVSLVPFFAKALDVPISVENLADWLCAFFEPKEVASVSELYNEASAAGSAKNAKILARHKALAENFESYFSAMKYQVSGQDGSGSANEAPQESDAENSEGEEVDVENYQPADGGIWDDIENNDKE